MNVNTGQVMSTEDLTLYLSRHPEEKRNWKQVPFQREREKTGRNEPCPCMSGIKFKKCCMRK